MKKTLLTNPAFRYIFEIIVIVFSVTLSFYIQDILNEKVNSNSAKSFETIFDS